MAVEESPRLGVATWSTGDTPFLRTDMNASHENLEARVAGFYSGSGAPALSGDQYDRSLYLDVSTSALYFYLNGTWVLVGNPSTVPASITPGAAASAGSSLALARADHVHALSGFNDVAESVATVNTTKSAGVSNTFARSDHQHTLENSVVTASKISASAVGSGLSGGAGTALSVSTDNATLEISGGNVRVRASGIGSTQIDSAVAGAGLTGGSGSAIAVGQGSGITVNANDIQVNAGVGLEFSGGTVRVAAPGAGTGLSGGAGNPLSVNVDNSTLEISGNVRVKDLGITTAKLASAVQQLLVPTGAVFAWSTNSAPTGWLLCDGTGYSTSTYATLFGVIGTTYGGSGGTFNVPDLTGRTVVGRETVANASRRIRSSGAGAAGIDTSVLGNSGGHESTQQHLHQITDPGHAHAFPYSAQSFYEDAFGSQVIQTDNYGTVVPFTRFSTTAGAQTGITSTQNNGSGNAQNVQPILVLNYIIKT